MFTAVWAKTNGRPESVRDRLSQRYEVVFLLVRQDEHWFRGDIAKVVDSDVWTVAADRGRTGHRAAGTVEIARRCVQLGCPVGGVVLDPFSGSGTTGVAALAHGCSFIGIDLDPECHALARRRLGGFLAAS